MIGLWQILTAVAIALMIGEIYFPHLILFPLGVSLLISAPWAYFIQNTPLLIAVIAINAAFSLAILRKIFFHTVETDLSFRNFAPLIGKEAQIVDGPLSRRGQTYIKWQNKTWPAIVQESQMLAAGTPVIIMNVEGKRIIVSPKSD